MLGHLDALEKHPTHYTRTPESFTMIGQSEEKVEANIYIFKDFKPELLDLTFIDLATQSLPPSPSLSLSLESAPNIEGLFMLDPFMGFARVSCSFFLVLIISPYFLPGLNIAMIDLFFSGISSKSKEGTDYKGVQKVKRNGMNFGEQISKCLIDKAK